MKTETLYLRIASDVKAKLKAIADESGIPLNAVADYMLSRSVGMLSISQRIDAIIDAPHSPDYVAPSRDEQLIDCPPPTPNDCTCEDGEDL